jgi:hypothetical protein
LDNSSYFYIILYLLLIVGLILRIMGVHKLLKTEEDIVKVKRFASIGIFFGIIGLVQLGFWIKGLIEFQGNIQENSFTSTGLASILIALGCIDYNLITKDGIIKLNSKYKWDNIKEWCWKKDHYNVAVFKAYVSPRFSKKMLPKLKNIELNVSQKQRNEVEKLLIQYIGEEVHEINKTGKV